MTRAAARVYDRMKAMMVEAWAANRPARLFVVSADVCDVIRHDVVASPWHAIPIERPIGDGIVRMFGVETTVDEALPPNSILLEP